MSYVSTYRPSLSIKLRIEVPHNVPLNRDFIRNDMAIKWLPWGRSGDSQIKASKMLTGVSNRHFFPCCPQNAMSSRAIARDLLILQLSSHICNFATSSLVSLICHVIPSGSEGSPYSSDTFTLFQLHPFVLIAPVCISFYLENFSSGACS